MEEEEFKLNEKMTMMKYGDIIDMPHHQSKHHQPMSQQSRAAQFGSFAAVAGHAEALAEYARFTDTQEVLGEDQRVQLDRVLLELQLRQDEHLVVRVRYFCPDTKKEGGAYEERVMRVARVDTDHAVIEMEGGEKISIAHIFELELCSSE